MRAGGVVVQQLPLGLKCCDSVWGMRAHVRVRVKHSKTWYQGEGQHPLNNILNNV